MLGKTYERSAIEARLKEKLPHWSLQDGTLCRIYRTASFKATLLAANAIGHLAEIAWHHPELCLSYNQLTVRLMTHSAQGITDKDFALAAKIEALLLWQPESEGDGLEGPPSNDARFAYILRD